MDIGLDILRVQNSNTLVLVSFGSANWTQDLVLYHQTILPASANYFLKIEFDFGLYGYTSVYIVGVSAVAQWVQKRMPVPGVTDSCELSEEGDGEPS